MEDKKINKKYQIIIGYLAFLLFILGLAISFESEKSNIEGILIDITVMLLPIFLVTVLIVTLKTGHFYIKGFRIDRDTDKLSFHIWIVSLAFVFLVAVIVATINFVIK